MGALSGRRGSPGESRVHVARFKKQIRLSDMRRPERRDKRQERVRESAIWLGKGGKGPHAFCERHVPLSIMRWREACAGCAVSLLGTSGVCTPAAGRATPVGVTGRTGSLPVFPLNVNLPSKGSFIFDRVWLLTVFSTDILLPGFTYPFDACSPREAKNNKRTGPLRCTLPQCPKSALPLDPTAVDPPMPPPRIRSTRKLP